MPGRPSQGLTLQARPELGGASARCAEELRGGRKCVPSGGPCRAPARRLPATQVSAEGAGEGLSGGGSPGRAGKSGAGPRGRRAVQPRVGDPRGRAWTAAGRGPCASGPDVHFRGARAGPRAARMDAGLGGPGGLGCWDRAPYVGQRPWRLWLREAVRAPTAMRTLPPGRGSCLPRRAAEAAPGLGGCAP